MPPDKQRAGRATGKSLPVQRAHGSVSCRGRGAWGVGCVCAFARPPASETRKAESRVVQMAVSPTGVGSPVRLLNVHHP